LRRILSLVYRIKANEQLSRSPTADLKNRLETLSLSWQQLLPKVKSRKADHDRAIELTSQCTASCESVRLWMEEQRSSFNQIMAEPVSNILTIAIDVVRISETGTS
jgi:hypothetical protein